MVLPLVAAAPYITGGIATLGAGMYAAQPYIQKAVDDYINRSVTPTGEGLVIGGGPKEEIKTEQLPGFNRIPEDYSKSFGIEELQIPEKENIVLGTPTPKKEDLTLKTPIADDTGMSMLLAKLDERSKPVLDAVSKGFENYIAGGKNPDDLSIEAFGEFYLGKKDLIKAKDKKLYNFNARYAKLDSESIAQLPDKFEKGERKSSRQLTKDQAIERRNFIINNLKNSGNPSVVEYFNSFENDVAAFDNLMGDMRSYRDKTGRTEQMLTMREEQYLPRMELIHKNFGKQIKNGEIDFNDAEELLDIASTLGVDPNTASKDIYRYIQMHAGLFEVPGFETKNRKLDPLIGAEITTIPKHSGTTGNAFNLASSDGYYNKKIGVELFGSEFGYRDLREPLINRLKKINNQEGRKGDSRLELDEVFSRGTLVQNGMEEYSIFVQPLEKEINSKSKANKIDKNFGKAVIELGKKDEISRAEFNKTIADYNSYKKAFAEEHPDVFVPTFVYGQFTKNEQKMLREQFPDLADRFIKSAEEKGYHFKIDKNFKNVYDFAQGGRVGYKEGGSVKPKINPIDYIEYYSDGTKLYKINSFIRDIARQIDY